MRALDTWHVLFQPATLYNGPEIELALGARVEAEAGERQRTWFGMVKMEAGGGLRVQASTEAPRLLIFRPGRTDADVIRLDALSQMTSDPNVVRLQLFVVGIIAIVGVAASLSALSKVRRS